MCTPEIVGEKIILSYHLRPFNILTYQDRRPQYMGSAGISLGFDSIFGGTWSAISAPLVRYSDGFVDRSQKCEEPLRAKAADVKRRFLFAYRTIPA